MPRLVSVLDYDVIKFIDFPLDQPVVVIEDEALEQCVLVEAATLGLLIGETAEFEDVVVKRYATFYDLLEDRYGISSDEEGTIRWVAGFESVSKASFMSALNSELDSFAVDGIVRINELTGGYTNRAEFLKSFE